MPSAIEINGLSKSYRRSKGQTTQAVENLSLCVPSGQVLAFLGPNGAGKTTTIKMICGLVTPDTGTVALNGYDVRRQRSAAMRQIGAVLEGTRNVYWRLSAWDNLMYFGRLKGCSGAMLKHNAEQLLRELELWERRHDLLGSFSRGMQQKVAIACALVADPPIILLDEPTLGLDVQAARTVKAWIQKLSAERGKTVVVTTHQLDMVEEVCQRVVIMAKGRVLADHSVYDILHLFSKEFYQIKVQGHLNGARPSDLNVSVENGDTLLTGEIADQATLHSLLNTLHQQGLPLVSVTRVEPDLEEVFMRLLDEGPERP